MTANTRYAQGTQAWGECTRSGQRMLLRDMVEDPRSGLLVHPDWAEMPDPRPPEDIYDGIALQRPAPDLSQIETVVDLSIPVPDFTTGDTMRPLLASFEQGAALVVVT